MVDATPVVALRRQTPRQAGERRLDLSAGYS